MISSFSFFGSLSFEVGNLGHQPVEKTPNLALNQVGLL
jgi:hypothetical protein